MEKQIDAVTAASKKITNLTSDPATAARIAAEADVSQALEGVEAVAQAIIEDLGKRTRAAEEAATAAAAAAKKATRLQEDLRLLARTDASRASRQKTAAETMDDLFAAEMRAAGEEPVALYHVTRTDLLVGAALVVGTTLGVQRLGKHVSAWRAERKAEKDAAAAAAPSIV